MDIEDVWHLNKHMHAHIHTSAPLLMGPNKEMGAGGSVLRLGCG